MMTFGDVLYEVSLSDYPTFCEWLDDQNYIKLNAEQEDSIRFAIHCRKIPPNFSLVCSCLIRKFALFLCRRKNNELYVAEEDTARRDETKRIEIMNQVKEDGYYFLFEDEHAPVVVMVNDDIIYVNDHEYMTINEIDNYPEMFLAGPIINKEILHIYI